jgi:ATPase subunit of ABC transporter with duplicated ATPase domains
VNSSGHVEVAHVSHVLPDGRTLLDDVSFRIGEGITAALVGPNGAGKTTLLRLVAGDIQPQSGTVVASGGLGVMRQFIGGNRAVPLPGSGAGHARGASDRPMVRDLLLSVSPPRVQEAAARLDAAELAMMERDDERTQLRYATALTEWGEAGGYAAEVHWDACCVAAFGIPYEQCRWRDVGTLSGGEQKRLVLESLLRGPDGVLLLDEPDNYLDVPGKRWLEQRLAETPKTVLLVSHDRELLAACAQRIVTVEDGHVWVHGGGFADYAQARTDRISRLEELRRRWDEEHDKLKELVRTYRQKAAYNSDMASRLQAAVTRLRRFEEEGPPEQAPREQNVRMRLRGGRTGKRAVICENLTLTGLTGSFGAEIWFDDRVAVLEHALLINEAMAALARYELQAAARQPFGTLSGGQQARLQILLLELAGATLLLLDEPTDNLDLPSAEALQQGLESYQGTVLAVTHDRWLARSFDRFLLFMPDGNVREMSEPVWD